MDAATIGMFGGIAVGVAGGLLGSWLSIKNAKTRAEKSLIVRYSVACWLLVVLFLAALQLTPNPYNLLWLLPYLAVLTYGILRLNHDQKHMRILSGQFVGR